MTARLSYIQPAPTNRPPKHLRVEGGDPDGERFTFFDYIEIRRLDADTKPGVLYVDDETVSSRHCVISHGGDGRYFLRDLSRNGTRLDGRRLVPNIAREIGVGQVVAVGRETRLRLEADEQDEVVPGVVTAANKGRTTAHVEPRDVTVLVGDIRDYTALVQEAPPEALQLSVSRLFERLEDEVARAGGTVKEHHGDALFAFWEETSAQPHVAAGCRAALRLDRLAIELGDDRAVWALEEFPLRMDWALATGPVVIHSFGGDHPLGLCVIGEPVVLAFRIEKLANDETGSIVACPVTRREAGAEFVFEGLGPQEAKGFPEPVEVFALRAQS